jgi:hypothetical protein
MECGFKHESKRLPGNVACKAGPKSFSVSLDTLPPLMWRVELLSERSSNGRAYNAAQPKALYNPVIELIGNGKRRR